ncbi:transporter substrate-binding domain-containing protein [Pantoea sp. A4]|uniref:transporter substrate-binding domain-containing protein n=1 Tax=Pantoea sp. A4 TaxID=1225184 RepID=UPI000382969F|nr:transporter substrate-binding domain-containing protein [Pantoea sp. A4]
MPGRQFAAKKVIPHPAKRLIKASVLFMALAGIGQAQANELQDVKAKGSLVCGTLATSDPMGFTDPKTRKVVGFDVDICAAVAKHLGVKMEQKTLTVDARIPELQVGRVNILSAALGYTHDRAKQIDFTSSHFQNPITVLTLATSAHSKMDDLAGKRIGMTSGSTAEYWLRKKYPNITISTFQDMPSAFMAFQQNKVSGLAGSQTSEQRYLQAGKGKFVIVDEPINWEPQALGIKKGEPQFLAAVNNALADMEKDGETDAIWNKWLGEESIYKMPRVKKLVSIEVVDKSMN